MKEPKTQLTSWQQQLPFAEDSSSACLNIHPFQTPLVSLPMSTHTTNALLRAGIETVEQLLNYGDDELLLISNIGNASLYEIRDALKYICSNESTSDKIEQSHVKCNLDIIRDFLPISVLSLSQRTINALVRSGIFTVGDVAKLNISSLLQIQNIGLKSVKEILDGLSSLDTHKYQEFIDELWSVRHNPSIFFLEYFGLSNVVIQKLHLNRIRNIADLQHFSPNDLQRTGFSKPIIGEITGILRAIENLLGELEKQYPLEHCQSSDITTEKQPNVSVTSNELELPVQKPVIPILEPSEIIEQLLLQVTARERMVLVKRYGLDGEETSTLEQIGDEISCTRERVRQIEKGALYKLKKFRNLITPLELRLYHALNEHHGVLSMVDAQDILCSGEGCKSFNPESLLLFVLCFINQIKQFKKEPMIFLDTEEYASQTTNIQNICTILSKILDKTFAPLPKQDLLSQFAEDRQGAVLIQQVAEKFICACLDAHPDIVCTEDNMYGLRKWSSRRTDDIIMVLRQHGEPLHYKEITRRVNERLLVDQQTTPHNVHSQIGRMTNLFVRVGHGIFGLAEWGLAQDRTIADAAYRVLTDAGYALEIEQLTDKVLETWHVKRTSVKAAIDLDDRFVKVGHNLYWLKDQSESGNRTINNDFDTLFGESLLKRQNEIKRIRETRSTTSSLDDIRDLGTDLLK